MGRIIKLTEQDLARIVRGVINERAGATHNCLNQIAKLLKPYGYKQLLSPMGPLSVWKGDSWSGTGVVYWETDNKFKVYVKNKDNNSVLSKTFELSVHNNYDTSGVVNSVVSILKKL
jgi:hypothetical protein